MTKEFGSGETRDLALRGVDLDVAYGEMTLLVGPSGCGKTTLISIIAGLLDPTERRGRACSATTWSQLARRAAGQLSGQNIGFVFQQYNLLPALTAAENAAVPLVIAGEYREQGGANGQGNAGRGRPGAADERLSRRSSPAASSSAWRSPGP